MIKKVYGVVKNDALIDVSLIYGENLAEVVRLKGLIEDVKNVLLVDVVDVDLWIKAFFNDPTKYPETNRLLGAVTALENM